jgi:hypothetical protein
VILRQDLGPSKSGFGRPLSVGNSFTAVLNYVLNFNSHGGQARHTHRSAVASSRSAEDAVHVAKVAMIGYVKQRISH